MKSRAHGTGELARRAEWKRGGVNRSWATVRERGSIFRKRFYRQMMHRGKKRAVIAADPALLAVVWQVLQKGIPYAEPSNEVFQQREHSKKVRHHLRKLKELGVYITPSELSPLPEFLKTQPAFTRPLGALGIHAPENTI
jgi:hypothetical protein